MSILTSSQLTFTDLRDAYHIQIDPDYIALHSDESGAVNGPETININFGAYMGETRVGTVHTSVGELPVGVTVNSADIIEATTEADGSIKFSISDGANLDGVDTTTIQLIFPILDSTAWYGRNLIVQNTLRNGYRINSDGTDYAASAHSITAYFPVEANCDYTLKVWAARPASSQYLSVAFYSADKTFISRPIMESAWNAGATYTTIAPINAAYARVSFPTVIAPNIKFERGNIATDLTSSPEDDGTSSFTLTKYVTFIKLIKGESGVGVASVTAYYAVDTSGTTKPSSPSTTEWDTILPTVESTQYLWVAYLVTYTDGTMAWTEPYCVTDETTRERVSNMEASMTVLKEQISSKVSKDGIISEINQTAETVKIQASKINLDGTVLVAGDNGAVTIADGSITADKINVTDLFAQDITATGTIRGVKIEGATGSFGGVVDATWLKTDNRVGFTGAYDADTSAIYCQWADGDNHDLIVRNPDGLTAAVGWIGSSAYPTVLNLRAVQTNTTGKLAVSGALTVSGGATCTGAIYSDAGIVAANGYGFYIKNASGTNVRLINLTSANAATVGHASYTLGLYGSSITASAALTVNGTLTSTSSVQCGTIFGCTGDYASIFTIYCKWADGANHNLVERSTDGLTSSFGWAGSSTYKSVTRIRGQTVQVLNSSGTTTLSDGRLKKDWHSLDPYDAFFDALNPQAFKYINGSSGRYHLGFSAQHVEQTLTENGLTNQDFGGVVKFNVDKLSDEYRGYDEEYGLIYTEFIALNTHMIQKLKRKVEQQALEIEELKRAVKQLGLK